MEMCRMLTGNFTVFGGPDQRSQVRKASSNREYKLCGYSLPRVLACSFASVQEKRQDRANGLTWTQAGIVLVSLNIMNSLGGFYQSDKYARFEAPKTVFCTFPGTSRYSSV